MATPSHTRIPEGEWRQQWTNSISSQRDALKMAERNDKDGNVDDSSSEGATDGIIQTFDRNVLRENHENEAEASGRRRLNAVCAVNASIEPIHCGPG
jgi:hypothetical protein